MKTNLNKWSSTVTASLLAIVLVSCSGCAGSPQWQAAMAAREVAPGKGADGKCQDFAQYVAPRIPGGKTIRWQWSNRSDFGTLATASHVAVTWTKDKEIWMMDNFSTPVWVGYITTPRNEQVKQFMASFYRYAPIGQPLILPVMPTTNATVALTAGEVNHKQTSPSPN